MAFKQPISYYGGKQKMLKHLLEYVPPHHLYCEPCAGGATMFWNKPQAEVEVLNDINRELVNFYEVIKYAQPELEEMIQTCLHSRSQHKFACIVYENPDYFNEIRRAWAVYVLANQSYHSILGSTWGYERLTGKTTKAVMNKKALVTTDLAKRLERVQIECVPLLKCIKSRDTATSFFYIDPPYPNTDQGHYEGYSMQDFVKLLDRLTVIKGKFLLSSYDHKELGEYAKKHGWHQVKYDKHLSASNKKNARKVEVLTMNYTI